VATFYPDGIPTPLRWHNLALVKDKCQKRKSQVSGTAPKPHLAESPMPTYLTSFHLLAPPADVQPEVRFRTLTLTASQCTLPLHLPRKVVSQPERKNTEPIRPGFPHLQVEARSLNRPLKHRIEGFT